MKKLLLTLLLLSFADSALANGLFQTTCVQGVEYIYFYENGNYRVPASAAITVRLLPSGKPATCNY